MQKVSFTVYGKPKGKQRPRVVNVKGFSRAYTPKETVQYENLIKIEYGIQTDNFKFDDDAQLGMSIKAYFPIAASKSKKQKDLMERGIVRPISKPDCDNLCKLICDSINDIAYKDDSRVVSVHIQKFYSCNPRVEIEIWEICE